MSIAVAIAAEATPPVDTGATVRSYAVYNCTMSAISHMYRHSYRTECVVMVI